MDTMLSSLQRSADAIWAALSRAPIERTPARIVFTGTASGVGTTSIAAAAALGLARNLRVEVGLLETDVEQPGLAGLLGLYEPGGLSDILDGRSTLKRCVRPIATIGAPDVRVLVAGSTPRTAFPGELASEAGREVLDDFESRGRFLIVDAPPVLERPETRYLLTRADGAVLVLQSERTEREEAERALEIFAESGVAVLGTVLNRFRAPRRGLTIAGRRLL